MTKQLKVLFVFLLVVISFNFFEARFLSKNIKLFFWFLYIALSIALSLPFIFRKRQGFVLPIQLIFLSMLISIFMAYISWGQSIMNSILATVPYMLWIFFFYLLEIKIPIKTIEKIILIYGIIYIILYFYQFTHPEPILFGYGDEFSEEGRGIIRIRFPGGGIFYLASFMAINKLTTQKDKRWLWFLLSILGVVVTVMQVTRSDIFALSLLFFYHLVKDLAIFKKFIVIISFIGLLFFLKFLYNSNNPIVEGIVEQQKSDIQAGENNIRVIEGNYFLTEFSPNNISRIFGNGVPYALETEYALYVDKLTNERGFYFSDVGIIGMYAMFGILSVFAYILIWIKSFTLPIPKEFNYVKYYLWYLLITSLTSYYVFHSRYLIATVFALYIYQTIYEEKKETLILNHRSTGNK